MKCICANFCHAQPRFSVGTAERCLCQSSCPAVVDAGARKSCRCAYRAGNFRTAAFSPSWRSKPHCALPALHSGFPGSSPGLGKGLWHRQGFGTGHNRLEVPGPSSFKCCHLKTIPGKLLFTLLCHGMSVSREEGLGGQRKTYPGTTRCEFIDTEMRWLIRNA